VDRMYFRALTAQLEEAAFRMKVQRNPFVELLADCCVLLNNYTGQQIKKIVSEMNMLLMYLFASIKVERDIK
jgi:hypothetical protein